jgi:uncharacterized protein YlxW (UPF0749 family)
MAIKIKLILITILLCLSGYLIMNYISAEKNRQNFLIENKQLNNRIDSFQKENFQLATKINDLQIRYNLLEKKSITDSLIADSLSGEYNNLSIIAENSNKKANYYMRKFINIENKINLLETNKVYKKNDSLLISLSKKIN